MLALASLGPGCRGGFDLSTVSTGVRPGRGWGRRSIKNRKEKKCFGENISNK